MFWRRSDECPVWRSNRDALVEAAGEGKHLYSPCVRVQESSIDTLMSLCLECILLYQCDVRGREDCGSNGSDDDSDMS